MSESSFRFIGAGQGVLDAFLVPLRARSSRSPTTLLMPTNTCSWRPMARAASSQCVSSQKIRSP